MTCCWPVAVNCRKTEVSPAARPSPFCATTRTVLRRAEEGPLSLPKVAPPPACRPLERADIFGLRKAGVAGRGLSHVEKSGSGLFRVCSRGPGGGCRLRGEGAKQLCAAGRKR